MNKNLTDSQLDRQNILNNNPAISEIQEQTKIQGILFEDKICFTKAMAATFYEVDVRTIERYVSDNQEELILNGYEILTGQRLKAFLQCVSEQDVPDINVGNISNRTPQISIFDFRAFLNLAMLMTESEEAKSLRQVILDIVIDFVNKRTYGGTKYINQRDQDFIASFLNGEDYHKEFTNALYDCLDMGNSKYAIYTDKIYKSIFREKAREYRNILNLSSKEKVRDTFYSEVLDLISSYECGLASLIREQSTKLGRKLNNWEVSDIFTAFESLPLWKPLINKARSKMASRDLALRDVFHNQLRDYVHPLEQEEYERFLGDSGDELEKLMQENQDVLHRLKERG